MLSTGPVPLPGLFLVPIPVPFPVPVLLPVPFPVPVPVLTTLPVLFPVPLPLVLIPVPVLFPVPIPVPFSVPVPIPVIPVPVPVPFPVLFPVPVPFPSHSRSRFQSRLSRCPPQVIEAEARAATRWELSEEGAEVLRAGSPEVRLFRSLPPEGLPQSDAMVRGGGGLPGGRGRGGTGGGPHRPPPVPSPPQKLPGAQVGFSKAMANKWLRLDKAAPGGPRIFRAVSAPHTPQTPLGGPPVRPSVPPPARPSVPQVEAVQDAVQDGLRRVQEGDAAGLPERERNELKRRKLLLEV